MLLSRLAETAFWLGRYLERAGSLSRAIVAYEHIRLDIPGQDAPGWQRLASLAGVTPETAARLEPSAFVARVLLDRGNPSALLGAVQLARENLRRARFLLPSECWHTLNAVYLRLEALGADRAPGRYQRACSTRSSRRAGSSRVKSRPACCATRATRSCAWALTSSAPT